jgi:hypothetical protein
MAREYATPLNTGLQGQVQDRTPQVGLNVAAQPVDQVGINNEADRRVAQFARNMSEFTGAFDQFSQAKAKEVIQGEQEKAVLDNIKSAGAKPVMTGDESAWYQDERLKLYGQSQTMSRLRDLNVQLAEIKADPEKLRTTDPQKFLDDWFAKNAAGIDDPTVAGIVYPTLQKAVAEKADDLILAKRGLMAEDRKKALKDAEDNAASYATSQFYDAKGMVPAQRDARVWSTWNQTVAMLGGGREAERKASAMVIQAVQNAQHTYGDFGSDEDPNDIGIASALVSKNPQAASSGRQMTLSEYLGNDKSTQDALNGVIDYARTEKKRRYDQNVSEANAAERLSATNYANSLDTIIMDNKRPSLAQMQAVHDNDQVYGTDHYNQLIAKMQTQAEKEIVKNQGREIVFGVGADRSVAKAGAQETMESFTADLLDKANSAWKASPANTAKDYVRVGADGQPESSFLRGIQQIATLRNAGNTTLDYSKVKAYFNTNSISAPKDVGGKLNARGQQGLEVYLWAQKNDSFRDALDVFMAKEDQQFYRIVAGQMDAGGVVDAFNFAKQATSPENRQRSEVWLSADQGEKKSLDAAKKKLRDREWSIFDDIGQQADGLVNAYGPEVVKDMALTNPNTEVIGNAIVEKIRSKTLPVEDPQDTAASLFGVKFGPKRNRLFLQPTFTADQTKAGITPTKDELAKAIRFYEDNHQDAWKSTYGEGVYQLQPDLNNPNMHLIYRNGSLVSYGVSTPAVDVWNYATTAGQIERGVFSSEFVPKGLDPNAVRTQAKAQVEAQYAGVQKANSASKAAAAPSFDATTKAAKKQVTPSDLGLPATDVAPFTAKKDKKMSRSDFWTPPSASNAAMLPPGLPPPPPGLPPLTMAGGAPIIPSPKR